MNDNETSRIIELSKAVWSLLTQEEREGYYYTTGVIGFIEDICGILKINDPTYEAIESALEHLDRNV